MVWTSSFIVHASCLLSGGTSNPGLIPVTYQLWEHSLSFLSPEMKALDPDTPEILTSPPPPPAASSSWPGATSAPPPLTPSFLLFLLPAKCPAFCLAPAALMGLLKLQKGIAVTAWAFSALSINCSRTRRWTCECIWMYITAHLIMVQLSWGPFKQKTPLYEILSLYSPIFREEGSLNPFQIQRN